MGCPGNRQAGFLAHGRCL